MRVRLSAILLASLLLSLMSETAFAASVDLAAVPVPQVSAAMDYVAGRGLLSVQDDGLLHPEFPLTRIDLIHAIVRDVYSGENRGACFNNIAPKLPASYSLLFTDVPRTDASAEDVCIGMFVGIVNGRPDGSLQPLHGANLAETAKVVTKAYGIDPFLGLYPNPRVPWHEPYWYALARRHAIPETLKARSQTLTRGEFAEVLYNLRSERPTVGFRSATTFARRDGTFPILAVRSVVRGTIEPTEGLTLWQRDRLALAARERSLVVPSPPTLDVLSQDHPAALEHAAEHAAIGTDT